MPEKLTKQQQIILKSLDEIKKDDAQRIAVDNAALGEYMQNNYFRNTSYSSLQSALVRLEKRGLVRRYEGNAPGQWEITQKGTDLLSVIWGN